jgi:asparagine synthetase A
MAEEKVADRVVIEKVDRLELENLELKLGTISRQIEVLKEQGDLIYAKIQALKKDISERYGVNLDENVIQEDGTVVPRSSMLPRAMPGIKPASPEKKKK